MQTLSFTASDGASVACYRWPAATPRACVQIAHGMGEHAQRYDAVGAALAQAGYEVYANDHRGHGVTGQAQLGYMGGDGWNRVLADAYEINRHIAGEHHGLPLVLLGHSMGSMMAQQYITRHGDSIDALALSGSPGFKTKFVSLLSSTIARFEVWRLGSDQDSALMQRLLFGDANRPFSRPGGSEFEWLSRDPSEVQKYVDDDACGFVLTSGSLVDLFAGAAMTQRPECLCRIPKGLPIYVFSGVDDPVHSEQKDMRRMLQAFDDQNLQNVDVKWYPGGRHEMFNETNRDEVIGDLLTWLDAHLSRRQGPTRA